MLILGTVIGAVVSFAVAIVTPPSYESQVTLLLTPPSTAPEITFSDVEVAQALAPTFAELSTKRPLLERVIAATGIDTDVESLAKVVATHVPVGTSLLDVAVTTKDPQTAAALANAIAAELVKYPEQGFEQQPSALKVALTVVDPAVPPKIPQGLGIIPRTILGGAIGLLISISLAFFVENFGRGAESLGRGLESARRGGGVDDDEDDTGPLNPGRASRLGFGGDGGANQAPLSISPATETAGASGSTRRDSNGRFQPGSRSKRRST